MDLKKIATFSIIMATSFLCTIYKGYSMNLNTKQFVEIAERDDFFKDIEDIQIPSEIVTMNKKTFGTFLSPLTGKNKKRAPILHKKGVTKNTSKSSKYSQSKSKSFKLETSHVSNAIILNIRKEDFRKCLHLKSFEAPNSLITTIGKEAFIGYLNRKGLKKNPKHPPFWVSLPLAAFSAPKSVVTTVKERAFCRCYSLRSFDISHSVLTEIGNYAFQECSRLTSFDLQNPLVTKIGSEAFGSCTGLIAIRFSGASIRIEKGAFKYCKNLIVFESDALYKDVDAEAFEGCYNLHLFLSNNELIV